jgi:hypothetical protein
VTTQTALWKTGSVASFTDAGLGSGGINGLINGNAYQVSGIITPGVSDMFMDLSFSFGNVTTGAGSPSLNWFLMPQNQDGTTYGDGLTWSNTTTNLGLALQPPTEYGQGLSPNSYLPSKAYAPILGTVREIRTPPLTPFIIVLLNLLGNPFGTGTVLKYKLYNWSLQ